MKKSKTNVLEMYSKIAPLYKQKYGEVLQSSSPVEFEQFMRTMGDDLELTGQGTILDVGCGYGKPLTLLCEMFRWYGFGFDSCAGLLLSAEEKKDPGVHFVNHDLNQLQSLDMGTFNVILFLETIGYALDAKSTIRKAAKILDPGGRLLIKCYDATQQHTPMFTEDAQDFMGYRIHGSDKITEWALKAGLEFVSYRDLSDLKMQPQDTSVYDELGIALNTQFAQKPQPYYIIFKKI